LCGHLSNRFQKGWAAIAGSRDVQHHQFIRPFGVVTSREGYWIAGVAQPDKIHAFDHAIAIDVQAWNDAMCQAQAAILRKLWSSRAPGAPLFSGWNCTAQRFSRSNTATNGAPWMHVDTTSASAAFATAAYE